ncbi:C-reactive protein [Bombina bombina]|uniref:C-reactive protein n=1 Tax=Bombina bombina TaxID=8345 RepID=UPI00235AC0F2|nr:C-reactive protein [Bombina bombina]
MEKILLLLLLLVSGSEVMAYRAMDGKVFLFPEQTAYSYVRLMPQRNGRLDAFTVCLRFYTTLTRYYSLFSLSTRYKCNDLLLFGYPNPPRISLSVGNRDLYFDIEKEQGIEWRSICVSWQSSTGVVVLWINGKPYPRKVFQKGYRINARPIIMIGQDQDSYGGRFDAGQSFVGEIADVYMWDRVLSNQCISDFFNRKRINGNVISWRSLGWYAYGKVNRLQNLCPVNYYGSDIHK